MNRYIDVDALIDFIDVKHSRHPSELCFSEIDVVNLLLHAPTADVAPVVLGWWERVDSSYYRWTPSGGTFVDRATYRCSHCGRGTAVKSNYCPNCGCRMDGEDGDE